MPSQKQPSCAVALFMWGIQGRQYCEFKATRKDRAGFCKFSIIFNYGYGAVSVDFGGGSDKIISQTRGNLLRNTRFITTDKI